MKQLFWKDTMEARFLPVTILLLSMIVLVILYSVTLASLFVPVCCMVVGLIAGCSGIASEFGRGTIKFLSSLPLSKKQVWLCKLYSTASISVFTCFLLTVAALIYGSNLFRHPSSISGYNGSLLGDVGYVQWWIVPISTGLFGIACSMFSSTLVDRPLIAVILSVVTALALISVFLRLALVYEPMGGLYLSLIVYVVFDAVSIVLLAASYVAFTHGNSAGIKRPAVLALLVSFPCLLVLGTVLGVVAIVVPPSDNHKLNYTYSEDISNTPGAIRTISIDCPRAELNHIYVLDVLLDLTTSQAAGIRFVSSALNGHIVYPIAATDIIPQARITFQDDGPIGKTEQTAYVLDRHGAISEKITIEVTNVQASGAPKQ